MKRTVMLLYLVSIILILNGCGMATNLISRKGVSGTVDIVRAQTLSDEKIIDMGGQAATYTDAYSEIADPESDYSQRLERLTENHRNEDDLNLNFKVYLSPQPSAFSFADGSIRVYSGLMDIMDEDELRFIIGHEIGHVKYLHSKNSIQTAYRTSAGRKLVAAQGGTMGDLADSEVGQWATEAINKKYSQGDESKSDNYGRMFMEKHSYPVESADSAISKLATFCGHNPASSAVIASSADKPQASAAGLQLGFNFFDYNNGTRDNKQPTTGSSYTTDITKLQNAGSFSAKIDGKEWTATITQADLQQGYSSARAFSVAGIYFPDGIAVGNRYDMIWFALHITGPGTYPLSAMSAMAMFNVMINNERANIDEKAFYVNSGEVKITAFDDASVKGTYHFVAVNQNGKSIAITDGAFDVAFLK